MTPEGVVESAARQNNRAPITIPDLFPATGAYGIHQPL